jgi:hypothetical protein
MTKHTASIVKRFLAAWNPTNPLQCSPGPRLRAGFSLC